MGLCEYLGRQLLADPGVIVQLLSIVCFSALAIVTAWKSTSILPEVANALALIIRAWKSKGD